MLVGFNGKMVARTLTHDTVVNMRLGDPCVEEVVGLTRSNRASQRATLTLAKGTNQRPFFKNGVEKIK